MSKKRNELAMIMGALLLLLMLPASGYGEVTGRSSDAEKAGAMQITISEDNMYVRYSYDDDYDLVTHWELRSDSQTQNNNSRPISTYKALKNSSLENAVDSENQIQYWQDSESPINVADYTWWAIFANQGYIIPAVTSAEHGKTKDDLQSVWVDQDNREYTLIGLSGRNLFLAPNITFGQDGKNTRSWDYRKKTSITTLTHVSGAVHTDTITVASTKMKKLYPLTKTIGEHKLTLDGQEISENGTYYGDCLEITETLACYDPATIPFTNLYPTIDLSGAEVMCYMTNNFTVIEGSITYKNSLDVRKPIYLGDNGGWGSNQAIHPVEQGTYKAYTFFPRSKTQDSPAVRDKAIKFRLNATWLKNIRKPIDRIVTYLYDPIQDDYKFGFASGISLISGDSVDAKRVITVGSDQACLTWSASLHKGYFQIIRGSHYENGVLPAGSYFEVVSYFVHWNPDKNPGQQVYWYKDGDSWVVYAHCQTKMQNAQINLPDYMEGLTATVIDKTAGAELQSSVVTDGHLDCKFISAGTTFLKNYLVIELKDLSVKGEDTKDNGGEASSALLKSLSSTSKTAKKYLWGRRSSMYNGNLSDYKNDLRDNDQLVQLSDWINGKVIGTLPDRRIGPVRDKENYRYMVVPCREGDSFTINAAGSGKSAARVYAFTKSDRMIIKRGLYTDYINKVITAPAGAAYLYINDKNSGGVCYKNEKNSGEASLKNEKSSGEASRNNDEYFKILCIGNSYTSDCTTYVPALLEDIAGVKIVMGKTYYKGARITQYIDWFDDDSAVITYTKYDPEASVWSEKIFNQTLKSAIADEDWDVITFSPGSGDIKGGTPSMVNTLINKVTKYYAAVHGKKEVKIGWLMPQMRPLELRKGITYEKCISMVQKILSQTPVEFVIPCITAIENARGTSLNSLGDYGSLAHDTAGHLQAGIPSLVTSYTTAMSIMKLLGKDYNEIQQKEIRPTDEWIESQNAPHHGDSVGVNEKNCYIALKCAIAAMKSPYKISIISESEF